MVFYLCLFRFSPFRLSFLGCFYNPFCFLIFYWSQFCLFVYIFYFCWIPPVHLYWRFSIFLPWVVNLYVLLLSCFGLFLSCCYRRPFSIFFIHYCVRDVLGYVCGCQYVVHCWLDDDGLNSLIITKSLSFLYPYPSTWELLCGMSSVKPANTLGLGHAACKVKLVISDIHISDYCNVFAYLVLHQRV